MKLKDLQAGDEFIVIDKKIAELTRKDRRTKLITPFGYNSDMYPNISINGKIIKCEPDIDVKLLSRHKITDMRKE